MVITMRDVIKWELYKILFAKHGAIFIVVYFIIQITFGIYNNNKVENKDSPITENYIKLYYEQYGGKLDTTKCDSIELKKTNIDSAVEAQRKALADYENGAITESDLDGIIAATASIVKEKRAFDKFYKSYLYCKEDINNRYLINTSSWIILLDIKSPDLLISFLITIMVSLSYIDDIKRKPLEIIKCTQTGYSKLIFCKLITFGSIAIIVGVFDQIANLIVSLNIYPLVDFNAPLQSLYIYANSKYNISLLETFILGSFIKTWGLVYLCIIINTMILIFNNVMFGVFNVMAINIIPYFLLNKDNVYLTLPLPLALVQKNIFFICNNKTNKWIFTSNGLFIIILVTFSLSILLISIAFNFYKKRNNR